MSDIYTPMNFIDFSDSKLPSSGTSVFARMTELANQHKAVNLAQGFPDFSPPQELLDYLYEGVKNDFNQYAPMPGLLNLREQLSRRIKLDYNYPADPLTSITVTAGATQAIYTIISSFIKKDDKVLIFEPAYDSYAPSVLVNGGIPIYLKLAEPTFEIPWNELENCIRQNDLKLIIINNPHNPAGSILTNGDFERINAICSNSRAIIVWDEVYDQLVYDGKTHQSALSYPELMEKSIVVFSLGKTLHNTGWKVGYTIAREELTREIRKLHQFTVFSVNTPAQYAIAKFIEHHFDFFKTLSSFYQQKRDFFVQQISDSGFQILPCHGSYFVLASYGQLSKVKDEDMAKKIVEYCGVAGVPISAFYHDQYDPKILRFCFAKKEETLMEGARRINKFKQMLTQAL